MRTRTEPHDATRRGTRDPRIEALRLVAIAGISLFHVLPQWLDTARIGWWAPAPHVTLALGAVSLLGAFGNNVFFLISGMFLVPRAADASSERGYWRDQAARTLRRALSILCSVALYAALALAMSAWVTPLDGVSLDQSAWLVGGLEFIWVYLAIVAACPLIGWVWRRTPRVGALVGALTVAVFAVNAYIAFVSPGSDVRGLLEWRKLMSAATYLDAFLVGGLLSRADLSRAPVALAATVACALAAEGYAAVTGDLQLVEALSFKSTSLLSFALAVAAVACAARPRRAAGSDAGQEPGPAPASDARRGAGARLVCALSPSVLGFYIMQSIFSPLWRPVVDQACQLAIDRGQDLFLVVGTSLALVLLAVLLLVDRIVRIPLLRAIRLA